MEPYTQVVVQLPKFTTTSTFYLASTLGNWGMTDAFSAKADFSGITSAEKIRLNQVIHKAYVDVKETGTEAAGATAIIGGTITAIVEGYYPPPPVYFWANHPFIFLIRDNVSGAILFMGRVTNPND
jgi:serpin B